MFSFDDREHTLKAAFAQRIQGRDDIRMESTRLNMGDVVIQKTDTSPLIVVERKQVFDLMSSLFDGRLAEQCSRMRQWQAEQTEGDVWMVMIVEGAVLPKQFRGTHDPDVRFRHTQSRMHAMHAPLEPS